MLYRRSKGANPAQTGIEEASVACAESGHETGRRRRCTGAPRVSQQGREKGRTRGPPGRLGWPASWLGRVRGQSWAAGKREQAGSWASAGGFDSLFF